MKEKERLITTADLAGYLNVCEHTIYRWCKAGKIPHYNLNKTFRFDSAEIKKWLESRHKGINERKSKKVRVA